MKQDTELPPRPGFRDWAFFAISMTFVVMGSVIAWKSWRQGIVPIVFFGVCALTSGHNIHRKLRRRRFTATTVLAPGGVKLQASNARMLLLAGLVGAPGLTVFFVEAPVMIRVCGWIMVGAAASLLFLVLTGRVSRRFIRFDPLGFTLGAAKFEYTVPWDLVADLAEFELHSNSCVGFNVLQPESVLVVPESARPRVSKLLGKNAAYMGRDVVIMAAHFAISAEALVSALRTYAENPQARAGLVPLPALEMGTLPIS